MPMDIKAWIPDIDIWLKIVGLLAAAVWAFFLLVYLRRREAVNVEIRRKESDIEIQRKRLEIELSRNQVETQKKEFEIKELELKTQRQISITVDIQSEVTVDSEGYILTSIVVLQNRGNDATTITWHGEPPPFTIRSVSFNSTGNAEPSGRPLNFSVMSTRDPEVNARSHVIRAGATETLTFAARLTVPGLYLLSFRGAVAEDVRAEATKYGVRLPTSWTAKRYVYIDARLSSSATSPAAA
jgi:hypothetical protein